MIGVRDNAPDDRLQDPVFVEKAAEAIEELACIAREKGVELNYHNHAWEFQNGAMIFCKLIEKAPHLRFCLDLGWVYVGGGNPIAVLEEHADRVAHVHLRDYSDMFNSYVNLGEGDLDFERLLQILKDSEKDGEEKWAIVEYEYGDKNYKRYKTAKLYLDDIISRLR